MNEPEQKYLAYDVCTGDNSQKLKIAVQKAVNGGWDPQGGIAVCQEFPGRAFYVQAIVKNFTHPIQVQEKVE